MTGTACGERTFHTDLPFGYILLILFFLVQAKNSEQPVAPRLWSDDYEISQQIAPQPTRRITSSSSLRSTRAISALWKILLHSPICSLHKGQINNKYWSQPKCQHTWFIPLSTSSAAQPERASLLAHRCSSAAPAPRRAQTCRDGNSEVNSPTRVPGAPAPASARSALQDCYLRSLLRESPMTLTFVKQKDWWEGNNSRNPHIWNSKRHHF